MERIIKENVSVSGKQWLFGEESTRILAAEIHIDEFIRVVFLDWISTSDHKIPTDIIYLDLKKRSVLLFIVSSF